VRAAAACAQQRIRCEALIVSPDVAVKVSLKQPLEHRTFGMPRTVLGRGFRNSVAVNILIHAGDCNAEVKSREKFDIRGFSCLRPHGALLKAGFDWIIMNICSRTYRHFFWTQDGKNGFMVGMRSFARHLAATVRVRRLAFARPALAPECKLIFARTLSRNTRFENK
jgi:hypothetical protein